jgi:hypothetical protein
MREMSDMLFGENMMKPVSTCLEICICSLSAPPRQGKHFIREGKVGLNRAKLNDDQLHRLRAKCEATFTPEIVSYFYRETST